MTRTRVWLLIAAAVMVAAALGGAMAVFSPGVVLASIGGVAGAALVAYLSQDGPKQLQAALTRRREQREELTTEPLSWSSRIKDLDYVVLTEPDGRTVDVPASGHTVQVVVTGQAAAPVLITGMRAEVVGRHDSDGDLAPQMGSLPVRPFRVDLDGHPAVRPAGDTDFPYRVERDETEVFDLAVHTGTGDVRWFLWLDWSTRGRTGSLRVDAGGLPFRTVARDQVAG
ncbi:hypothetical protein AB0M02_18375 [Actinoplanes sp. NPDC051861]|uniref:hypothetical protein n=1 Tax=Actinoplanes sp. NPDC051861 TaxID=3155170 RepID=UPI0034183EA6